MAAECINFFVELRTSLRLWARVKADLLRDACQIAAWSARYVLCIIIVCFLFYFSYLVCCAD